MPAVRLNRFLASTALVALLSAGGALAEPKAGMSMDTAPAATAPDQPAAKPDDSGAQSAAPAEATPPGQTSAAAEAPASKPQGASEGDEVPTTAAVNNPPAAASTEFRPGVCAGDRRSRRGVDRA